MRSHMISVMEGLEGFVNLELLELYDNQIGALECLSPAGTTGNGEEGTNDDDPAAAKEGPGRTLTTLDMSYNVIRDMAPVAICTNLQKLYLANNKLKTMAGLSGLKHLRVIDLGSNRLRSIDESELSGLENLEELWLGKNKIDRIQGLKKLTKLRRLDLQSNRLTVVENLETQAPTLEELYLANNGIDDAGCIGKTGTGLTLSFPKLTVLDMGNNRIKSCPAAAFSHHIALEELWLSGNRIEEFEGVQSLAALGKNLETLYLEYTPLEKNDPLYRKKLAELIPSLIQIDSYMIKHDTQYQAMDMAKLKKGPPKLGVAMTPDRIRQMQLEVMKRAQAETRNQHLK